MDAVAREMARDNVHQARAGYWYLDPRDGRYRPTWRGAALMTWKLAWPVGAIRRARRRGRTAALLRRLEAP
jgi:hypothetical protein